jgi:hypothetical protein
MPCSPTRTGKPDGLDLAEGVRVLERPTVRLFPLLAGISGTD